MKSFNVLDRSQNVCRNMVLEASAGTGKTFSIENLVVRLILENDVPIEKILIVTFTRPATRDLRVRVRRNIYNVIEMLKGNLDPFDYVESHLDNAESMIRRLQRALLMFDNAAIETIHGFCFRSLRENIFEGDMPLTVQYEGGQPGKRTYLKIIRDYFRTQIDERNFSPAQLERVSEKRINNLEKKLLKAIQKPFQYLPSKPFHELYAQFQTAFSKVPLDPENLLAYHEMHKSNYRSCTGIDEWMERFAQCKGTQSDFEFLIRDGFLLSEYYSKDNIKLKPKPHPELDLLNFVGDLEAVVKEARSKEVIIAKMAHEIQEMAHRYLQDEEMWSFDDLLKAMYKSIENPDFSIALRQKYSAVIVDEFQDTDPLQWHIFSNVFVHADWNGNIYIVGDPKQAIYAFRSADIYTYLQAVKQIGEDACSSLDINYRSHPSLLEELNRFFAVDSVFPLPNNADQLSYKAVNANQRHKVEPIQDGKPHLHCFVAEDKEKRYSFGRVKKEQFFPYIAHEIHHLRAHVPLNEIAILVRKQTEAKELADFLRQFQIPSQLPPSDSLAESTAVHSLRNIIDAALDPRSLSKARVAMGTVLLGWTDEQLASLDPMEALKLFAELSQLTVISFFQRVIELSAQHLLKTEEGCAIYNDLLHLFELVVKEQPQRPMSLETLNEFINELAHLEFEDDESIKRPQSSQESAVQIMTLHASKGLEFDVVFALGLATATMKPEFLVPNRVSQCIEAVFDEDDPRYQLYCAESDAEKMRLLYVALTRAKKRVYIPYIKGEKAISKKLGTASCMQLYSTLNPGFLQDFSHEEIQVQLSNFTEEQEDYDLTSPPAITIPWRERFISSFTSIVKSKQHTQDFLDAPHDLSCETISIHTLPAGPETGTFLHELFERISFEDRNDAKVLEHHLMGSPFKPWQPAFADLIERVQSLPFLAGLNSSEMYREIEFLYPKEQGLLKGVIDLIFKRDGLYYILDWKSNWLGPDESYYTQEHLWAAMNQHEYVLQASLYTEALRRYLEIIEDRPFEECFGGIYYVFLRGIGAEGNGVLHFRDS